MFRSIYDKSILSFSTSNTLWRVILKRILCKVQEAVKNKMSTGSFPGHALPGSFFIAFALWWTVSIFNRYFNSRRKNIRFTSTAIFPCMCLCGRLKTWPIEAYIKILFTVVGTIVELHDGFNTGLNNEQHITMYLYFGLTGVADILLHHEFAFIPPAIDYVMLVVALVAEGLLFKFHVHGRPNLDVLVHTLLVYTIFAGAVFVLLEMRFRHHILTPLARAYAAFVQGTWFWQIGFILFNPFEGATKWKKEDDGQMMLVTMIFTWHMAVDGIVMFAIGALIACIHRRRKQNIEDGLYMERLLHKGSTGYTEIKNEDTDSDI